MDIPGFGWVDRSKDKVSIVSFNDVNISGGEILNKYHSDTNNLDQCVDCGYFEDVISNILINRFSVEENLLADLNTFKKSNKSNGREMKWNLMRISRNCSFPLHLHPSFELVYVIKGTIHEYRMTELIKNDSNYDFNNISEMINERKLIHQHTSCHDDNNNNYDKYDHRRFIINEINSVHLSYTQEEETVLLVLWSGCQLSINKTDWPINWKSSIQLPENVQPYKKEETISDF